MNNYFINTIPLHNVDVNSKIIVQTVWSDDSIEISVYSSNDQLGFIGTISTATLTITANSLEINLDQFLAETKDALCSENGLPNFTYSLKKSDTTAATFLWCKSTGKGFTITYGSVVLDVKPNLIDEIMINSIRLSQIKDKNIVQLHAQIRRNDDDFNEMKNSLKKCVEEKNDLENRLLAKFALLLNSKKAKINELQMALKNRTQVDDEDYESDRSGDDSDMDYCTQTYVRAKSPVVPSTSHQQGKLDADVPVLPKRTKIQKTAEKTIEQVQEIPPTQPPESLDIYDRETELLMDEM